MIQTTNTWSVVVRGVFFAIQEFKYSKKNLKGETFSVFWIFQSKKKKPRKFFFIVHMSKHNTREETPRKSPHATAHSDKISNKPLQNEGKVFHSWTTSRKFLIFLFFFQKFESKKEYKMLLKTPYGTLTKSFKVN